MSSKTQSERRERFETTSGLEVPNDFNPTNTDPVDYKRDLGAAQALTRTRAESAEHVPWKFLDDAPVRRVCHGSGIECPLQVSARRERRA